MSKQAHLRHYKTMEVEKGGRLGVPNILDRKLDHGTSKKIATILVYIILDILKECVLLMAQPVLLGYIIDYFSAVNGVTYSHACWSAAVMCLSSALFVFTAHPHLLRVMQIVFVICYEYCNDTSGYGSGILYNLDGNWLGILCWFYLVQNSYINGYPAQIY
ncbi:unnamed protein product [Oppiella nova]|uniref:Uncharacterized protein n=1 Tax=Oppiella nova TaxID=334625 RepID=A0A7R9QIT2_9ACAR|nr:unnamed protein product [Oppiella nova]CAG2166693.1 unnamed protein product [Oppiella nova]